MPGEPPAYNWNEEWPASIATETGPTSDTTSFSDDSLPLSTSTHPLTVATTLVLSNAQVRCCNKIMLWSQFAMNHLISLNPNNHINYDMTPTQRKMYKNASYNGHVCDHLHIANISKRKKICYYCHHRKTEYSVVLLFIK